MEMQKIWSAHNKIVEDLKKAIKELQERIDELESELENKCNDCDLAHSYDLYTNFP